MNEGRIFNDLISGRQDKAFRKLYKHFPKVEKYILSNSGSKEEALDIFQEALIILYNKVNENESLDFKIVGYLIKTSKFLWSNELRKKKVRRGDDSGLSGLKYVDEIAEQQEKEEKFKLIENVLQNLGEKCKSILEMFYFKNLSMDSIAKQFGYKTVNSAKVQKYKCMESAREMALEMLNEKNQLS